MPKRGERRDLVEHARKNAREALSRKLADNAGQQKLLAALGAAFGLRRPPRRVEVYDNSHIMGTNAVGAMVVAGPDGFMKSHYRTFNISADTIAGDDFGMMREVLQAAVRAAGEGGGASRPAPRPDAEESATSGESRPRPDRRRTRCSLPATSPRAASLDGDPPFSTRGRDATRAAPDGDDDVFPSRPDLVIVDGGKGQFEAARKIMAELGVTDIPLVAHRQGRRPQRHARDLLRGGPRALQAAAARSGALFHPAPARRGAPLRHRHAPGQAQEGHR